MDHAHLLRTHGPGPVRNPPGSPVELAQEPDKKALVVYRVLHRGLIALWIHNQGFLIMSLQITNPDLQDHRSYGLHSNGDVALSHATRVLAKKLSAVLAATPRTVLAKHSQEKTV